MMMMMMMMMMGRLYDPWGRLWGELLLDAGEEGAGAGFGYGWKVYCGIFLSLLLVVRGGGTAAAAGSAEIGEE